MKLKGKENKEKIEKKMVQRKCFFNGTITRKNASKIEIEYHQRKWALNILVRKCLVSKVPNLELYISFKDL